MPPDRTPEPRAWARPLRTSSPAGLCLPRPGRALARSVARVRACVCAHTGAEMNKRDPPWCPSTGWSATRSPGTPPWVGCMVHRVEAAQLPTGRRGTLGARFFLWAPFREIIPACSSYTNAAALRDSKQQAAIRVHCAPAGLRRPARNAGMAAVEAVERRQNARKLAPLPAAQASLLRRALRAQCGRPDPARRSLDQSRIGHGSGHAARERAATVPRTVIPSLPGLAPR